MVADGLEVIHGVGAQLVDDGTVEVRQVQEAAGHTVSIGIGQLGPADRAGAAVHIVDHDGLANVLFSVLCQNTGGLIGAVTGLVGNDHGHRTVRRPRASGLSRSLGGGLCRGGTAAVALAAAGGQAQNQSQRKKGSKNSFHTKSPLHFLGTAKSRPLLRNLRILRRERRQEKTSQKFYEYSVNIHSSTILAAKNRAKNSNMHKNAVRRSIV